MRELPTLSPAIPRKVARGLRKLLELPGDLGHPVPDAAVVLDLGCGNGDRVALLRTLGYDAFGCDLRFKPGTHRDDLERSRLIRTVARSPYQLPFDDASFDYVFSEQVFEHVQNYAEVLAEIHRVLKPGAVSLHFFPSRWRFRESHVHVPLASVIQSYGWLWLWARLGIRKRSQQGLGAREVAAENRAYLTTSTNYLGRGQITRIVRQRFPTHRFCERAAMRHSRLAPLSPVLRFLPGIGLVLSTFQTRVLLLVKPDEPSALPG